MLYICIRQKSVPPPPRSSAWPRQQAGFPWPQGRGGWDTDNANVLLLGPEPTKDPPSPDATRPGFPDYGKGSGRFPTSSHRSSALIKSGATTKTAHIFGVSAEPRSNKKPDCVISLLARETGPATDGACTTRPERSDVGRDLSKGLHVDVGFAIP